MSPVNTIVINLRKNKMTRIKLTQGKYALIDDEDFDKVSKFQWCTYRAYNDIYYVSSRTEEGKTILMHRYILGLKSGDGNNVDHKNSDGLDNRKSNLRIATTRENSRNRRKNINNISGYKGVSWNTARNSWVVHIKVGLKRVYLGKYNNTRLASEAYSEAAKKYYGEFARTN